MDASCETYDEFTPLHTACELGNLEMIEFLLSMGMSPHHKNRFGHCPMYMAIKNRHCQAVKLMSMKGITVRLHPVRIAMEMIQAVQNKDYPLLQAWVASGVDMDIKDYNKRTVLHEAVDLGDKLMIARLLEYGATPLFLQSGVKWLSDAVALALNTVIQYVAEILESAGIDAKLPFQKVTPEGVIFVTQWALLAVMAYWILSFILRLVVGAVRQALWLLKITFAVGMFGLILSDTGASAETTAMRLAGLACVCVLLGIGATSAKQDEHLENKIKMLERRLREMEKSKIE
ncbi:L-asparaginase [Anabarilius grahami]|uniref:L-asparaginase n=1 Tax=Anabarilius grahami TaxID=495550 RepID=A0A3N0XMR2_ANAGA|nr:L-asparaginase [Anabarilius grahami]